MRAFASNSFSGFSAVRSASDARRAMERSLERLATGKRINRASDDPAGMVAVNGLAAQRKTLTERIKTFELNALSVGARDGALAAVGDLVAQLDGYVVSAANRGGMGAAELDAMQLDVDSIVKAIDHLSYTEKYGQDLILRGWNAASLGVSTDKNGDRVSLASLLKGGKLDLASGDLETAQRVVRDSLSSIATSRAKAGSDVKSVDSQIRSLQEELINTTDAQSRIEDADYASEVSELVRRQVMTSAADFVMKMTMDLQRQSIQMLLG